MLSITHDPEELVFILSHYTYDWCVVLDFLDTMATLQGVDLDTVSISNKMQDLYKEKNG